jgi:hypothetical protein
MREYRSSGSVEGVVSDHDSYSDQQNLHIILAIRNGLVVKVRIKSGNEAGYASTKLIYGARRRR